ncbi:glycosyltransferase family A protein [Haloarcula salina]|uniref:Glycosyltransferase family 2 protein n=1 Tax=Haloarcula salina TaxID=1429914 RepID=A0AA41KHA3_9EURY|nr:glycosyltransferase family A protein [Haloarcula salina]MBV0900413.1 glycosyltransferase family 2 protein [Haloarcula salina]
MSEEYKYTVSICNYNMENTIKESLLSILNNVNDDFEVLVVDESTDNSRKIIKKLQEKHDNLRLVEVQQDPGRNLGMMRNIGIREANGEFVLIYVDADDRYECGIVDFAKIYEQLSEKLGKDFYIDGANIKISSKDFLLNEVPHRNLPIAAAEEDFAIRLLYNNDIIYLDHTPFSEEIDKPDRKQKKTYGFKRSFRATVSRFQMGITFESLFKHMVVCDDRLETKDKLVNFIILPLAYLFSLPKQSYSVPDEFRDWKERDRRQPSLTYTLPELEEKLNVSIDRDKLSECGREKFYSVETGRWN